VSLNPAENPQPCQHKDFLRDQQQQIQEFIDTTLESGKQTAKIAGRSTCEASSIFPAIFLRVLRGSVVNSYPTFLFIVSYIKQAFSTISTVYC